MVFDGIQICNFISNQTGISRFAAAGVSSLPFDDAKTILIKRFISLAVVKIHKLHMQKLREVEAPWIKGK